jgi:hypothetical protein
MRTGILASMPDEPFLDEESGAPYDAYLVEMRSFGGLSGTPVFTLFSRGAARRTPIPRRASFVDQLALIGLIRGHWDISTEHADVFADDAKQANIGLALVTPAQKLRELLMRDDFVRERRK